MFFADDGSGARIEASPGAQALCPLCRRSVKAKCGELVEWHWAHEQGASCDPWSEGETPWHRWWKFRAPIEQREVVIGDHRADIRTARGVIELQLSPISTDEIREREAFYGAMIWVIDGRAMTLGLNEFGVDFVPRFEQVPWSRWMEVAEPKHGYSCWQWRRPRRSFLAAKKRIFIDLGDEMLEVAQMAGHTPYGFVVVGRMESRDSFLNRAHLRPIDESERASVLSYIVQYIPKSEQLQEVSDLHLDGRRPSPRRREFASLERVKRWIASREPEEYEVIEWRGSGHLRFLEEPRRLSSTA